MTWRRVATPAWLQPTSGCGLSAFAQLLLCNAVGKSSQARLWFAMRSRSSTPVMSPARTTFGRAIFRIGCERGAPCRLNKRRVRLRGAVPLQVVVSQAVKRTGAPVVGAGGRPAGSRLTGLGAC